MAPLDPAELEQLATARYGESWVARLAHDMGVSVPAASRWKKEGIANASRAAQVRALLVEGVQPPPKRRVVGEPPPSAAEFADWIRKNFRSNNHAADVLGLDKDTLWAMCSGATRNGNPFEIRQWVRYMMAGYAIRSHGELVREGRGKLDLDGAAKMLRGGLSTYAVAKAFDVTSGAVRRYQVEGRLPLSSRMTGGRPRIDRDKARHLLSLGWTNRQIAKELEVSEHSINRLQREGVLPRSVFAVRVNSFAQELLDKGASTKEVASQVGVNEDAIYRAIRRGDLTRPAGYTPKRGRRKGSDRGA